MISSTGKRWYVFAIATSLFVAAAVAQQRAQSKKWQPLNVKPGLWESTRTWTTAGEMPIPPSMLDRLTPEQRSRLEQRMKAQSAANNHTETDKSCVTKDDLRNPPKFTDKAECTWTMLESTDTKAKGNATCRIEGMELTGTGEFEAPDQEHINASIHLTSTSDGRSMTTDATIKSKWRGSSCDALK
jgi:Protein of unknown function (DUF3617)